MTFPNLFGPVESIEAARGRARLTAVGLWLWAATGLAQAILVTRVLAAPGAQVDPAVGFTVIFAVLAALLGLGQWRRPNRIVPIFGLAWMLYELSSSAVSLMVGAPVGTLDLPGWAAGISVAVAALCLILHVAALKGAAALATWNTTGSSAARR